MSFALLTQRINDFFEFSSEPGNTNRQNTALAPPDVELCIWWVRELSNYAAGSLVKKHRCTTQVLWALTSAATSRDVSTLPELTGPDGNILGLGELPEGLLQTFRAEHVENNLQSSSHTKPPASLVLSRRTSCDILPSHCATRTALSTSAEAEIGPLSARGPHGQGSSSGKCFAFPYSSSSKFRLRTL